MEQTNLVVTPDGKTWDEVTRDVSYLGNVMVNVSSDNGDVGWGSGEVYYVFDFQRGNNSGFGNAIVKDSFCCAYDRWVCLKSGEYKISVMHHSPAAGDYNYWAIRLNGTSIATAEGDPEGSKKNTMTVEKIVHLKRGDYIQTWGRGIEGSTLAETYLTIQKLG